VLALSIASHAANAARGLAALTILLNASSGPFAGLEHTRRPPSIEHFWLGLDPHLSHAPATGIVELRLPLERRVRIAGGTFVMGSTPSEMVRAIKLCEREQPGAICEDPRAGFGPFIRSEGSAHEVTLADFDVDRTEVPVRRYDRCVAAGACSPAGYPSGDGRYDRPDFPVTHVRWEDAVAYCTWIGGRLPTEAEWEHAARGNARTEFPWGDIYNPHLANHGALADDQSDGRDGFIGLAPIGSFPDGATASGLLDMAGNAAEWVADFYDRDEEGYGYGRGAQVNPKGTQFSPYGHAFRGGSYRDGGFRMRGASRRAWAYPSREIGFRCAYDVGGN
jgi:formylglycine-generating enzyme required for sulfatase activity